MNWFRLKYNQIKKWPKRGIAMNYIKRNLEKIVSQVTKEYPVLLVTGPRQVGKTTMLQKLMEGTDRSYVSLDDLNERRQTLNYFYNCINHLY